MLADGVHQRVIRPAAPSDAGPIATLSGQLGYPITASMCHRRLDTILQQEKHAVLVLEEDGTISGWVHVFRSLRLESEPFAEIGGLVVDERRRGEGRGLRQLEAAEEWAGSAGLHAIRIRSNTSREATHRFYERHGYRESKRQSVRVKELSRRFRSG